VGSRRGAPFAAVALKVWLIAANTSITGHSSGAEAAMRFAESYQVKGLVLVSACVTDLGIESEMIAGYYNR